MVDDQREKTMRERIGARASALVNNRAYLPRVRKVQNMIEAEEFDAIISMAEHAKDNPAHYFMKIISIERLESTLLHVRRLLKRSVEAMAYVARKINNRTRSYLNFVGDKIAEGKYSMAHVVRMVELAERKKQPDRYLIGILKKGFVNEQPHTVHR